MAPRRPGVDAIANVCGTCHTVFATKFALSTHSQIFDRGCVECHNNHDIAQPSDAMLGTAKEALCTTCHSDGDNGYKAADSMRGGIDKLKALDRALTGTNRAVENAGLDMADQALLLREAGNHLTRARTEMHAFDPKLVDAVRDGRDGPDDEGRRGGSGGAERSVLPPHRTGHLPRLHRARRGRAPAEDSRPRAARVGPRLKAHLRLIT